MDRLIVRMLPAEIRVRHGDELADMLSCSQRPIRDRADVVVAGLGLRLGRAIRPLLVAAVIGIGVLAYGLVQTVGHLRNGAIEIPDHWWSMLITCGFAGAASAAIVLCVAQRRAIAWRQRC